MKTVFFLFTLFISLQAVRAQVADPVLDLGTISPGKEVNDVVVKKVYSDSLSTSFVIWVKTRVPLHKHAFHTEQVYVLEGTARMVVGDTSFAIAAGDMIVIPANTAHSVFVTSAEPLKVLSIQSPVFDGTDRIKLEE